MSLRILVTGATGFLGGHVVAAVRAAGHDALTTSRTGGDAAVDLMAPGMIAAVEFVKDRASGERYDWRERRGLRAYEHALAAGALLRPVGNVVYLMPPYITSLAEIDWLAGVARGAVDAACA